MSRHREAGATPPGKPTPEFPANALLPLALLAAAVVAALLVGQSHLPGWLSALALLLACAGMLVAGAYWSRHRQLDKLREARLQHQLLSQLMGCWQWQTDAEHRLTRFQPPHGAPASAWVDGAANGTPLWQRFDDASRSLAHRMAAQAPIDDLQVVQPGAVGGPRAWRLRAVPRFDSRGRFSGYLGTAQPTEREEADAAIRHALSGLLAEGPALLCQLQASSQGWLLHQASPGALALLGLSVPRPGANGLGLPWAQVTQALPEGLRAALAQPQATGLVEADGWQARWLWLAVTPVLVPAPVPAQAAAQVAGRADVQALPAAASTPPSGPMQATVPTDASATADAPSLTREATSLLLALSPSDLGSDSATRALAAEHAAFSYTISHDLRAPIRVVEGFGRILKEDYGRQLDRIGNDHLDRVVSAAARMNQMIDALLSLSQLSTQPLARQPVNLTQLATYVLDDLRRAAPERQAQVHIAPQMQATGDPTLLRMALENLLGNAWKYSAKNASTDIRFEVVEQSGRPVYRISDNGAGFDMRFADRLFGVFQRLHSASDFQGTGVGLASVRRIVRRHGGDIWAESEVGQGARFYFTLKG